MEDVAIDHTMDLSFDIHGAHDDIDIDLDVAADRDGDVEVDDVSVHALDHAVYDADMVDEEYMEDSYNLHSQEPGQYDTHAGETYEAEMEDDYEEDIDAPMPSGASTDVQHSIPVDQHPPAESSLPDAAHESPERSPAPKHIPTPTVVTPAEGETKEHSSNQSEPTEGTLQHEYLDEEHSHQEEHAGVEEENRTGGYEANYDTTNTQFAKQEGIVHPETQNETYNDAEDVQPSDKSTVAFHDAEQSNEDPILRTVKIFYQENEMSLFPPVEDDPSETYFLQDVALAHEPINQLFHACRSVLDDHISEEEELMLDIDCLDLHISENESQYSSISLLQICQLYNSLCHNDGVDAPEPMCLSLTSKHSFDSIFNGLLQAADDGRGLSSISRWDDNEDEAEDEATGSTGGEQVDGYPNGTEEARTQMIATITEPSEEREVEVVNDEADHISSGHPDEGLGIDVNTAVPETYSGDKDVQFTGREREDGGYANAPESRNDSVQQPTSSVQESGEDIEEGHENEHFVEPSGLQTNKDLVYSNHGAQLSEETDASDQDQCHQEQEDYIDVANEATQVPAQEVMPEIAVSQPKSPGAEEEVLAVSLSQPAVDKAIQSEQVRNEASELDPLTPELSNGPSGEPESAEYAAHGIIEVAAGDYSVDFDRGADEIVVVHEDVYGSEDGEASDFEEPEIDISPNPDQSFQDTHEPEVHVDLHPATPRSPHGLYDIEEDIFKSPIPEKAELVIPAPSRVETGLYDHDLETGVDERHDGSDQESGELTPVGKLPVPTNRQQPLAEGSPTPVKRARSDDDYDDEIYVLDEPEPDLKRHRSDCGYPWI